MRAIPDPKNLRDYMQRLTAHPHNVGSPYDHDNAEWLLGKFKESGLDAHIETFSVLFPTPKERLVELVDGGPHSPPSCRSQRCRKILRPRRRKTLPTYNAYSIDGDGHCPARLRELRYAGRLRSAGAPWDFREGCDRHRALWPHVARHQAADGRGTRSRGLHHLFRSARRWLFRRGNVSERTLAAQGGRATRQRAGQRRVHGRSADACIGATENAKRVDLKDAQSLTKIPVLPISYADAQPLLAAMGGPVAPEEWRGGLPIAYRLGPGPAKVHLKVFSHWERKPSTT